jgi:4,5-DOPA dioxygenase extradiol
MIKLAFGPRRPRCRTVLDWAVRYLPLLYVIGSRQQNDPITFPVEGVDGGSISMLTVRVGGASSHDDQRRTR